MGTHAHMMRLPSSSFFGVETEHAPELRAGRSSLPVPVGGGLGGLKVGPAGRQASVGRSGASSTWKSHLRGAQAVYWNSGPGSPGSAWAAIARDLGHPELQLATPFGRVLRVQLILYSLCIT